MEQQTAASQPIRVAVLGGGAGALAAAYALSKNSDYDITVYEMGWRLGGKCASGRRDDDGRDQEHGLHVLGGFYHNAMGLLREAYDDWAACSPSALDFDAAFRPHSKVHVIERQNGQSWPVRFPFPENDLELGRDPRELNLITIAQQLLKYVFRHSKHGPKKPRGAEYAHDPKFRRALGRSIESADPEVLRASQFETLDSRSAVPSAIDVTPLDQVLNIIQAPSIQPPPPPVDQDPDYGILFEIAVVVARGILREGLWWRGFDAANDIEFTGWMKRNGLSKRAIESAYFRCGYDYGFAYENGDPERPIMAAGTGLRGFLRMVFTYNRSVFVHMDGGMGEIIFTPLYEVLKQRGVKFRFFHRVDRLELDKDGIRLDRISGTLQNRPKANEYDPLQVHRLKTGDERLVWPVAPIAERLVHPIEDCVRPEFLYESPWLAPKTSERFDLRADDDFDICVLGIPVGALHEIAVDLAEKIPEWRTMLDRSATTPTISAQLWQPLPTMAMGWPNGPTVSTANAPPYSSWADMTYLLNLELAGASQHLSYFCGPVEAADYGQPPHTFDFGARELLRANAITRGWLTDNLSALMPNARLPGANTPGDVDELYVRMNSFPSERYVLTVPGAVHHRLTPCGSFVPNLFLAGDWTRNGYDIGSFETAILSGLICARAITHGAQSFPGEKDRAW